MDDRRTIAGKLARIRTIISEIRAYNEPDIKGQTDAIDEITITAMAKLGYRSTYGLGHVTLAKKAT